MSGPGRVIRSLAAVVLIAGLSAGTLVWQTDDTWPFAQMRMFPGGNESEVALVVIYARLTDGRSVEMDPYDFHLRRAELEGQIRRAIHDPRMLGSLVTAYNRTAPADRRIVRLSLVRREGGRFEGVERELARWPA